MTQLTIIIEKDGIKKRVLKKISERRYKEIMLYLKHLEESDKVKEETLMDGIEKSLKEVKMIREGKLPRRTLKDMVNGK